MHSANVASASGVIVDVGNFVRAETDTYFAKTVRDGGFGKLLHRREPASIDGQTIVRMNRDTLYSAGVFDLAAGALTVTLPDAGKRFVSMQVISEDHYVTEVTYLPGAHTYDQARVGTRYVFVIVRTLADPMHPDDMLAAHNVQDAITVSQAATGQFAVPAWDLVSLGKVRAALEALGALGGVGTMFGSREEVDPVGHLVGTAGGWGGNPRSAAMYISVHPALNDGKTPYSLSVKDVPVDGFWSISVYNREGFFEKNDLDAYSINNLTAKHDPDGSVTIRFGGDAGGDANVLPITPGWNYTVRLYRPRNVVLEGKWAFPEATAAR